MDKRDLVINNTGLKKGHLKCMHTNKQQWEDVIAGETLIPFLGN